MQKNLPATQMSIHIRLWTHDHLPMEHEFLEDVFEEQSKPLGHFRFLPSPFDAVIEHFYYREMGNRSREFVISRLNKIFLLENFSRNHLRQQMKVVGPNK